MTIALKIHSIIGIILGLLFFYAPSTWYFILISALLIAWGILTYCFADKKQYCLYIKIIAYITGLFSSLLTFFSAFFIFSTSTGYIKNILIYIFFLSIFILSWSIISLSYLKKQFKR